MKLRYRADRRTLVWAFVVFPLVPALAYTWPGLALWLLPLALYASYCAGVLAHNQNHSPTFVGRSMNDAYAAWLSIFYGFPLCSWVPTHNQNHHRYLNGDGDASQTTRAGTVDTALVAFKYPFVAAGGQLPLVLAFARDARTKSPLKFRRIVVEATTIVAVHGALIALGVRLHGVRTGLLVYLASAGLPAALASYFMMLTNYLQHVGCEPASRDDHSRNFTSPFFNWFVFENGLHTVHHEHPGVHWSRYRALHEGRAARIRPDLNQNSLFGYALRTYVVERLRNGRASPLSRSHSNGHDEPVRAPHHARAGARLIARRARAQ
jgi:beta-carotene hydroxylase